MVQRAASERLGKLAPTKSDEAVGGLHPGELSAQREAIRQQSKIMEHQTKPECRGQYKVCSP